MAKKKGIISKSKKKRAAARAVIKKGKGKIRINHKDLETIEPAFLQELIKEPLEIAGPIAKEVDINVNVRGGGYMGQTISARSAIAKALLEFKRNDEKLKKQMLAYDRVLLVDDSRRVESKKQLGTKARKKKQSSKR